MKCVNCGGKGFREYEAGLIMVKCQNCEGTGEIPDGDIGTESDNKPTGSGDTSEHKQPSKPKARRKSKKRS